MTEKGEDEMKTRQQQQQHQQEEKGGESTGVCRLTRNAKKLYKIVLKSERRG
jgi:hypothetical protein